MKAYSFGDVVRAGAWSALLGGAAGFVLGLLLAPEEGDKVRRRLSYRLEHLTDRMGTVLEQAGASRPTSDARRTGDALVADLEQKVRSIQDDIDSVMKHVRRGASAPSE